MCHTKRKKMNVQDALKLHGVLKSLGQKATPLRLTIARNLKKTEPHFNKFNEQKDNKFNDLVQLDSEGNPVVSDEFKKIIEEGKLNPAQGLPLAAHVFESEDGLKELNEYLEAIQKEEVELEVVSISLSKQIRIPKDEKEVELVPLAELLEAPDSLVTSDALVILMDSGILTD